MSQAFSTDQLPVAGRSEGWQGKAREICGDCRFRFPQHDPFHGSIDVRILGSLELMRFCSTAVSFTEFPSEAAHSRTYCIVTTQLEGVRCYSQSGRTVILEPGDSTLIDCGLPWSSQSKGDSARLYLRIPRELLANRLRSESFPIARRIVGSRGIGATLFQIADSLFREAESYKPVESAAALDAYFDILRACLGWREFERMHHAGELLSRVLNFIETHLAEPALEPLIIASAVGISVRHLHRLFARQGYSLGEWIRRRRLQQCRIDLADLRFRDRSITDIAFFWGFSDSAHFSHSFRKQFGLSPRTFRALAGGEAGRDADNGETKQLLGAAGPRCPKPN